MKKTGIYHLYYAIKYAFDGFIVLTKEVAFWHEVILLIGILITFTIINVSAVYYAISLILWCILIAIEAMNTAIEHIVDKISPEISDFAKKTKDLGSLAVFFMLVANIVFTISVVLLFI